MALRADSLVARLALLEDGQHAHEHFGRDERRRHARGPAHFPRVLDRRMDRLSSVAVRAGRLSEVGSHAVNGHKRLGALLAVYQGLVPGRQDEVARLLEEPLAASL